MADDECSHRSRVKLLNIQDAVVEWQTRGLAHGRSCITGRTMRRSSSEIARRQLDAAAVPYVLDAEFGDPARLITETAKASGCANIVMRTRGLGGVEALVLDDPQRWRTGDCGQIGMRPRLQEPASHSRNVSEPR